MVLFLSKEMAGPMTVLMLCKEAIHVQGAKRGTSTVRRVARKVKSMLK